jgi:2',3'-cyclic-nucleotide 2'-phosphodiesterase (5'-nucleotidase family)
MLLLVFLYAFVPAQAQMSNDPGAGPNARAQAIADVIRDVARSDAAFVAAGLLKSTDPGGDLSAYIQYPTDEIVVVKLSGSEIKEAIERSVSSYPDSSSAFLQISGMTVRFNPKGASGSRVQEIKINDSVLDASRVYTVAMPESLARGALGYFRIWDRAKISSNTGVKLENALAGKTNTVRQPRYFVSQ